MLKHDDWLEQQIDEYHELLIMDSFDKIAHKFSLLTKTKNATMSVREVQSDVRLVFLNELPEHAITQGTNDALGSK